MKRAATDYLALARSLKETKWTEARAFNICVGARVMEARRLNNMEQAALAQKLGIGQSSLSRIETGESACTLYRLVQIARAVGYVTVNRLIP